MKLATLKLTFFLLVLTACDASTPKFTPNSLDHFVIDFFVERSVLQSQIDKNTFYFYEFEKNSTFELESNDTYLFEKKGSYEYTVKSNTKAVIDFSSKGEKGKKHNLRLFLRFEDANSGTWKSPRNNTIPGAESGSFVIVQSGAKK